MMRLEKARGSVEAAKTARHRAEAQLEQVEARRAEILASLEGLGVSSTEDAAEKLASLKVDLERALDELEVQVS